MNLTPDTTLQNQPTFQDFLWSPISEETTTSSVLEAIGLEPRPPSASLVPPEDDSLSTPNPSTDSAASLNLPPGTDSELPQNSNNIAFIGDNPSMERPEPTIQDPMDPDLLPDLLDDLAHWLNAQFSSTIPDLDISTAYEAENLEALLEFEADNNPEDTPNFPFHILSDQEVRDILTTPCPSPSVSASNSPTDYLPPGEDSGPSPPKRQRQDQAIDFIQPYLLSTSPNATETSTAGEQTNVLPHHNNDRESWTDAHPTGDHQHNGTRPSTTSEQPHTIPPHPGSER